MMSFKKNYIKFDESIDFNFIATVLSSGNYKSQVSSRYLNDYILESVFQIRNVDAVFGDLLAQLNREYNKDNKKANLHIFYSMVQGTRSNTHRDPYGVHIVGGKGRTLYKVGSKEYIVEPGDLLYIPSGVLHTAIGLDPRIIISYAIY
tara:strand:+ start:43 stop:486 length:444 start_codon:yes stop_codon:yes gene_type:complete